VTREALLDAIYAAPEDDERRRVYADWLLQQGDRQGEFIHLQLATTKTPDQIKRERALFVVHSDRWLDELGAHPLDAVFERGFLAIAKPRGGVLRAERGWATVHTLLGATPRDDVPMPGLRSLRGLTDAHVSALANLVQPLSVRELEWIRRPGPYPSPFPPYEGMTTLPKLRRLVLLRGRTGHLTPASDMTWLWSPAWTSELDELVVDAPLDQLPAWLAAIAPTRLRSLELRESYEDNWESMWRCVVQRDDAGVLSRLDAFGGVIGTTSGATYGAGLVAAIEGLRARTLTSARVTLPKAWAKEWREPIERSFAAQIAPTIEVG
jgi:uncharacterized protein (TIGR02996 family)